MTATEILASLASRNLAVEHDVGGRYWLRSGRAGFTVQDGEIVVLDRDGVPCTQDGSGRVADVAALVRELGRLEGE